MHRGRDDLHVDEKPEVEGAKKGGQARQGLQLEQKPEDTWERLVAYVNTC